MNTHACNPHARYPLLDELRGVAAVGVLVFHIGTRGGGPALMPNGYLAVDFFFMLSGFVIAEAYEQRLLGGLSFPDFVTRRLIRMAPVAMLGALVGGAYLLARYMVAPARSDGLGELLAGNLLNLFVLPKLWHAAATGWELFPANGPLWSLFFEIAINLVWASALVGRSTRMLGIFVLVSGAALALFGLRANTLDLGWQATSLAGGAARVGFGFGVGLLLHRARWQLPHMRRGAAWVALVALVYFMALPLPVVGWTLAVVLLCLPAVLAVAIAAGDCAVLPGGGLLGRLSYPLYGIHVPLIAMTAGVLKHASTSVNGNGNASGGWPMLVLVPLALVTAYGVLVGVDEPIRAILSHRFSGTRQSGRSADVLADPESQPGQGTAACRTGSEVNLSAYEGSAVTA